MAKIKRTREKYFLVYNSLPTVSGENNTNEGEIFFLYTIVCRRSVCIHVCTMYVYAKQDKTMISFYMYCTLRNALYISSLSSLRKTYTFVKKIKMLRFFLQILRVGVTGVRYVSLPNARSWVIHNFRDTRGRGRLQQTVDDLVRYL